jgi:hypothetical protein
VAGEDELPSLTVKDADNPSLGLTHGKPGDDWSANTGETQTAEHSTATRRLADKGGTLRSGRRKTKKPQ